MAEVSVGFTEYVLDCTVRNFPCDLSVLFHRLHFFPSPSSPVAASHAGFTHALQLISFKSRLRIMDVLPQGGEKELKRKKKKEGAGAGWMFFWKVKTLFNLVLLVNRCVSQLGGKLTLDA